MKKFELFVKRDEDGDVTGLATHEMLKVGDLDDEESVKEIAAGRGKWETFTLKPATGEIQLEIQEKLRVIQVKRNKDGGEYANAQDVPELPFVRIAVVMQNWTLPDELSERGLSKLHPILVNALEEKVLQHLYPSITADPDFIAAWNRRQAGSAPENAS